MKLTISAALLAPAIKAAAKLAPKSNKIPQLECVRIDVTPDITVISAANLVESLRLNLPAGSTVDPGVVFVPSENMLRVVKEAVKEDKTQDITIEWNPEKLHAHVSFGRTKIKLPTENPENQRVFKRFNDKKPYSVVPGKTLAALVRRTAFSVQKDFTARTLGGISVKITDTKIELAATDGRRISVARVAIQTTGVNTEAVVPVMTPALINSLIDEEDPVGIQITGSVLIIRGPNGETTQRLIAGEFPPYESHVPWTSPNELEVDRKELLAVLNKASLLKVAGGIEAKFVISADAFTMTATAQIEGSVTDQMPIEWPHQAVEILLDHVFIEEALKSMTSDTVIFGAEAFDKPFILREQTEGIDAVNVILPKVPA